MVTGFEGPGLKIVVDALLGIFKRSRSKIITREGEKALKEAMRELLCAPANLSSAEAKLRIAKAAGILNNDVEMVEDWLKKHRDAGGSSYWNGGRDKSKPPAKRVVKKAAASRPAKKPVKKAGKKVAVKRPAKKPAKAVAKKAAKLPVMKSANKPLKNSAR